MNQAADNPVHATIQRRSRWGSIPVALITTSSRASRRPGKVASGRRNLTAAKRFLSKALKRHGRPERIVIDGSQTNREAILYCDATNRLLDRSRRELKPIRILQSRYLNNRIEQDHRAVKRRVRPMLGFKSVNSARAIIGGIEMIHMIRKGQAKYACKLSSSLAEQFERLAA
jgi:transposase-like protein